MPDDEFGILWQRRLRNQLDDRSASEIERVLEIRVRSLERRERVLGQRSVDGTTTPAFLALENDGFDTPILRLVGRATDAEFLRDVSQRVEARLDEVEERIVRRNASRHGTVVWVPHPDRTHSDVYRLIRGGFDDSFTSEEVHWIAGLPSDERRFQEVASVGVLVDSVAEATARVERAGGTVVVQSSHETGLYAVVADPANELVLLWEPPATAVPLAVQGWARCVTGQVLSVAEFYRAVVGWNTAVIRGGPPMGGVWLRGDEPIGALFEDRSLGERSRFSVALGVPDATGLVSAAREGGYVVASATLSPLPGRQWSVTGSDSSRLHLVAALQRRRLQPLDIWRGLASSEFVLLMDLRAAFHSAEEALRTAVSGVTPRASEDTALLLRSVVEDELAPVSSALVDRLVRTEHPSLLLEGAAALRPMAQGLSDDMQLVVQAMEDTALQQAYEATLARLVTLGVIAELPPNLGRVRVPT